MNELEARYRRLFNAYPMAHRLEREDEMVSVLLDVAQPGQIRPSFRQATASVMLVVTLAMAMTLSGSTVTGFTRWYAVTFACFLVLSVCTVGATRWSQAVALASGTGFGGLLVLRFVGTYVRYDGWGRTPVRLWEHVSRWSLSNDLLISQSGVGRKARPRSAQVLEDRAAGRSHLRAGIAPWLDG